MPEMSTPRRSLLFHHDFLRLWFSQTSSLVGLQFGTLAIPLVAVVALHATAAQAAILTGLGMTPWLVLGGVAGAWVDRWRRRPILLITHLGRAVVIATVPVAAVLGVLGLGQLYAVVVVNGVLTVFFETAYHSYLPSLVPTHNLAEGNGKLAVTDGAARAGGPTLAGLGVARLGAPYALWAQVVAYLASALAIWRIRANEPAARPQRDGTWHAVRSGARFIAGRAQLRSVIVSEAGYLFCYGISFSVLIVFFSRQQSLDPTQIGIVFTAGSVGGIVSGLFASRIGALLGRSAALWLGGGLRAVGLAAIPVVALARPELVLPVLIAARFVNAFGWTVWDVHRQTVQQLTTPTALLGRVNGSALFLARGGQALGGFVGAALAVALGATGTLVVGGVGAVAAVLVLLGSGPSTVSRPSDCHRPG